MRACGRCGHSNADHLKYCFSCGRRLLEGDRADAREAPTTTSGTAATTAFTLLGGPQDLRRAEGAPTAYAPTIALGDRPRAAETAGPGPSPTPAPSGVDAGMGAWSRAWDSLRYVFVYVRGRIDAEARKRQLLSGRDDAVRVVDSVLFGLGQVITAENDSTPELADLTESIAHARVRRETAIADLAVTEKLQASEDLRLGIEQSRAETEWTAYEARAAELDKLLRALEQERKEVDQQLRALEQVPAGADSGPEGPNSRRAALHAEGALVDERYSALRERAAALRASNIAARAKFDQATTTRRQAAQEIAGRLSAHTRDRLEAERAIHELTLQIGRTAARLRVQRPSLLPRYDHLDRLHATIEERDRQLAGLQGTIGAYDARKLTLGIFLLALSASALAAAVATLLWVLRR